MRIDVDLAKCTGHGICHRGEHGVADAVAPGVVDALEVIDVAEQDAEVGSISSRLRQGGL